MGRRKQHNTLASSPKCQRETSRSSSTALCPPPWDRAWPQQEHTQAMQERADTVPKGRAGSPHPGLANLGPFCCLQCYDLSVWKNNCLLRMIKDTGVTHTGTHVSAQGEDRSRASQLNFWWHSKSAEWFYGWEFTWHAESVTWERSSVHKPEIHICKSAVKEMKCKSPNIQKKKKLIALHILSQGKIKHID